MRPHACAVTFAVACSAVACFPPALDDTGRRCDVVNLPPRNCDDGEICFRGVCGRVGEIDAGPENWLTNPSFEDLTDGGDIIGWHWQPTSTGRLAISDATVSHGGLRSVRLITKDGGDTPRELTVPAPVSGTFPGEVWCATAWVRSNLDAGVSAALIMRENDDAGMTVFQGEPDRPRVRTEWQQLQEEYQATGAATLDLRVTFGAIANRGEVLWFDEVTLKRIVSGHCTFP
jgi:hypothetical protein